MKNIKKAPKEKKLPAFTFTSKKKSTDVRIRIREGK